MNVEEYISSGILESYVMDHLTISERAEVELMIRENIEIREEVARIEETLEKLAFSTEVEPRTNIKFTIMAGLKEGRTSAGITYGGKSMFRPDEEQEINYSGEKEGGINFLKYAAAASVLVALGAVLLALNYWSKWQDAEGRLLNIIAQNQEIAENYNTVNQRLENLQESVTVMNSQDFKRVMLNGTDNAPRALATVYWNKSAKQVFLHIQKLKELSKDQQYQLWAIIDGKPVDAGVFDLYDDSPLLSMKNIGSDVIAFAVTIEPRGGSISPSLETMQVLGNV